MRKEHTFMKKVKKTLAIILTLFLSITLIPTTGVSAAQKAKLNKTKATIYVGKTITLKLKNNKDKVKWSSSNKKVATVSSKGKVKGKKAGKITITAKVGKKKYKCRITVKKKVIQSNNNNQNNDYENNSGGSNNSGNNTQYVPISVKEKIINACKTYGKYSSNSNGDYYYLDYADYANGKSYYTQVAYYPLSDLVRISFLGENKIMVYYDIEDVNDTTCSVTFFDDVYGSYGKGILYKSLLNNESAVVFTSSNMNYNVEKAAEKLTTSSAKLSLFHFDAIMVQYAVGVTHRDLGFDY